jgi:hypothetical protein
VGAGVVRERAGGADDLHRGLSAQTPPPRRPHLALTHDVRGGGDLAAALFADRLIELGLSYVRTDGWATSALELPRIGRLVVRHAHAVGESVLVELDDALVELGLWSGRIAASVASTDEAAVERTLARLRELLPVPDPSSRHEVAVTFWTYGPQGPIPSWRSIDVPDWDEIRENYPEPTRGQLERLMVGFRPAHGGQLILWHGVAGTGKTFGLRALAWEWRDWCDLHYVVDPDTFFGEHADYLMAVLLQPEYESPMVAMRHHVAGGVWMELGESQAIVVGGEEDGEATAAGKWRVLLLEDTGDLLAADARVRVGQGLSRFLNVVDGLIGQGLRVLVLVTTNEEIRALHPAVARPGRAAANVEFTPLPTDEANAWLERREVAERVERPTTLAVLYALEHGLDPGAEVVLPGFGD